MRGRGRKLVAIQTEAHTCQEQSLAVCRAGSVSATQSCECSAQRLAAKKRWSPTFLAIVLTSSSNMTRARSPQSPWGLDCHEFSSAPSHANAWSTRFLPGQMFPARAQTITHGTGSIRLTARTRCVTNPPGTASRVHETPTRLQLTPDTHQRPSA